MLIPVIVFSWREGFRENSQTTALSKHSFSITSVITSMIASNEVSNFYLTFKQRDLIAKLFIPILAAESSQEFQMLLLAATLLHKRTWTFPSFQSWFFQSRHKSNKKHLYRRFQLKNFSLYAYQSLLRSKILLMVFAQLTIQTLSSPRNWHLVHPKKSQSKNLQLCRNIWF